MTTPFTNSIVGEQGTLVRAQIKSPNFNLAGQTGWAILKNGSAYFFNITATGTITATTFLGTDFELATQGAFWYSGTPASGNPPVSWITTSATSSDPFGNALPVSGGFTTIAAPSGGLIAQLVGGGLVFGDTLAAVALTENASVNVVHTAAPTASPILALNSAAADASKSHSALWLLGFAGSGGAPPVQIAMFGQAGSAAAIALDFILCGTLSFGALSGGLPTPFGVAVSGSATGILVAPAYGATPATSSLVEIQGTLQSGTHTIGTAPVGGQLSLVDSAAGPGTPSGATIAYSGTGQLKYAGEDGNEYNTGHQAQILALTTITGVNTVPTWTNIGNPVNVGAISYIIHAHLIYTEAAGAVPRLQFALGGSAVCSSEHITGDWQENNAAATFGGHSTATAQIGAIAGPTMAGNVQFLDVWVSATFSTAGSIQCQGNTSIAGDNWIVQAGSFIQVWPVSTP